MKLASSAHHRVACPHARSALRIPPPRCYYDPRGETSGDECNTSETHSSSSSTKTHRERLEHIRRVILAERKRLEDMRAKSFAGLGEAVKKVAKGELGFVRSILLKKGKDGEPAVDDPEIVN